LKNYSNYLLHILDETAYILDRSTGLTVNVFLTDETLKRAFVRSIEIIGEAVKNLPDDYRAANPQIEWRKMAATRDRLIHGYFSIDFELIWDIVQTKIPDLDSEIRKLLAQDH